MREYRNVFLFGELSDGEITLFLRQRYTRYDKILDRHSRFYDTISKRDERHKNSRLRELLLIL